MIYLALTEAERDAVLSAIRGRIQQERAGAFFDHALSLPALDMEVVASKLEGRSAPKDRRTA